MEVKQIAFIAWLVIALGAFGYTVARLAAFFKLTKNNFEVDKIGERITNVLLVAFGQTKILRRPVIGIMHALVWWGFLFIQISTIEIVIDGIAGQERILGEPLGIIYDILFASGDVFAAIIVAMIAAFLFRRIFMHIPRFYGPEMKPKSKLDANVALGLIMGLMVSLLFMNAAYIVDNPGGYEGVYPVSALLAGLIPEGAAHTIHEINWWIHIVLVFVFLNFLPYSKHFHVIMSVPSVFLTRLEPMTKMVNMPAVTKEVEAMMDPALAYAPPAEDAPPPERFGIKDIEDVPWKNFADSLSCTECGRCTSVCPANTTGKLLSPRKIMIDIRRRMNDKGPGMVKDAAFDDGKALVHDDYVSIEELRACTTCNACVQECPVEIDQVSMILDMRRYLVMEESNAPGAWNAMFTNIENNGAPWQFSPEDRFNWADDIEMNAVSA